VAGACGAGVISYVFVGHALNPIEGNLLFEPLGYANGQGIYAAIGILLAVGLALELERLCCARVPRDARDPRSHAVSHPQPRRRLGVAPVCNARAHATPSRGRRPRSAPAVAAVAIVVATTSAEHGIVQAFGPTAVLAPPGTSGS
jgi:hypothetical protein